MVQVESNKRDNDALKVTTALLRKSPDYYTIWNVRRTILKEGFLDNAYVLAAVFLICYLDSRQLCIVG